MADSIAGTRPLVDTYGLYVDGRWVDPDNGRYDVVNPATEEVIATAPDASVAQVGDAIAAARRAFDSGPWSTATPEDRAHCVQQLSNALLERLDDTYALAQAEWGCSANERMFQIEGPAFMAGRAAELAAKPVEEVDGRLGRGGHHGPAVRAARCRLDPDAVELPAHPQRHEGGQRAGRGKHRRAQAVAR